MGVNFHNGRPIFLRDMDICKCGILILLCIQSVLSCPVFQNPHGNITDDQQLEVGSPFLVRCHLFPNVLEERSLTSIHLILKHNTRVLENVWIVDNQTVEYRVPRAIVNDTGYYSCFLNMTELVCSTYVAVGYKPQPVSNFTCISKDYSNLTCSWNVPFNPVDTNYELYDYLRDNERFKRKCPLQRNTSCEFRLNTKPPYFLSADSLKFILNITNSLGSYKEYFKVDHFPIVKPDPVRHVTFNNVTPNGLVLRASSSKGLEHFALGLVYSVKYYSVSTKLSGYQTKTAQSKRNLLLELTDLVPHTQYNFEIKFRLNITNDDFYWSDVVNATERTDSDVPYLAPETINSAFDSTINGGNRTINIYWKAVPSEYENGEDFHYLIRYHKHYVSSRFWRRDTSSYGEAQVVTTRMATYSFRNMDANSAYMFNIIAVNSVGNSTNETTVVVDKWEKLLSLPKDITVISYGQNYSLTWSAPDDADDITHYTIYWCQTLMSRPAKCLGPIGWLHTPNTFYSLPLSSHNNIYQFAVAANRNHQTSGMVWASCIAYYDAPYDVRKIEVIPRNSTSLRVRWTLGCEAQKKVIREYSLHYCAYEGDCAMENWKKCRANGSDYVNWPHATISDSSTSEYTLSHLKPFTCYFVYIEAFTPSGRTNSNFTFEQTMAAAPDDPPSHVRAVPFEQVILVIFDPPKQPNGNISRYIAFYNQTSRGKANFFEEEFRAHTIVGNKIEIRKSVSFYSNYSIELAACVDRACSAKSKPVSVYTGLSSPSVTDIPRIEMLEKHVNITWNEPSPPNGPIDFYEIRVECNETDTREVFNVTGQTHFVLERDCETQPSKVTYDFFVRAVNLKDGVPLYGEYSKPIKSVLCPGGSWSMLIIGIICGAMIVCFILIYWGFKFAGWLVDNAKEAKKAKVVLPKGLQSSFDNPFNYDKFKSGLQNEHDAGVPSVPNGVYLPKEAVTRSHSDRNNSGDSAHSSTQSAKYLDSVSSANTTKTHVSMDSGAEVDQEEEEGGSNYSPDGFFSDSGSSSNAAPAVVVCHAPDHPSSWSGAEGAPAEVVSRDSGLETCPKFVCNTADSKAVWYVRRKPTPTPFVPLYIEGAEGLSAGIPFAAMGDDWKFVPWLEPARGVGESQTLSNSEPSVADFEDEDGTQPLMMATTFRQYSRYGISGSAGDGLNNMECDDRSWTTNPVARHSKYGTMYRPVKPEEVFNALNFHSHQQKPPPEIVCFNTFGGAFRIDKNWKNGGCGGYAKYAPYPAKKKKSPQDSPCLSKKKSSRNPKGSPLLQEEKKRKSSRDIAHEEKCTGGPTCPGNSHPEKRVSGDLENSAGCILPKKKEATDGAIDFEDCRPPEAWKGKKGETENPEERSYSRFDLYSDDSTGPYVPCKSMQKSPPAKLNYVVLDVTMTRNPAICLNPLAPTEKPELSSGSNAKEVETLPMPLDLINVDIHAPWTFAGVKDAVKIDTGSSSDFKMAAVQPKITGTEMGVVSDFKVAANKPEVVSANGFDGEDLLEVVSDVSLYSDEDDCQEELVTPAPTFSDLLIPAHEDTAFKGYFAYNDLAKDSKPSTRIESV